MNPDFGKIWHVKYLPILGIDIELSGTIVVKSCRKNIIDNKVVISNKIKNYIFNLKKND